MNIVLIGYRGAGKSTVAHLLAADLKMPEVCLDEEIVKRAGKRIPEIVADHGWEYFRDLESEVVEVYASRDGWVIDAGGGVILREKNVLSLRRNGILIWLTAPPSVLIERIREDTERPALKRGKTFLEEVEEVLEERYPLYRSAAHFEIDVSERTPEQAASRIQAILRERDHPGRHGG
jgi:shikimate kinase